MPSDPCECDCKCGRPKQPPGGPESDGRLCADCDSAACDLLPGPTWDEALAVIRRHYPKTADWLDHHHCVSRLLSLRGGVPRRALAELESEALDLYEKLRQEEATDAE